MPFKTLNGALNFLVLQWFFYRRAALVLPNGKVLSYWWVGPVLPLSGWWGDYVWLTKQPEDD